MQKESKELAKSVHTMQLDVHTIRNEQIHIKDHFKANIEQQNKTLDKMLIILEKKR